MSFKDASREGREKIKESYRTEKKKMKGLTWKQKLQYIWDYYKVIFVIILVICAAISMGVTIYRNARMDHLLDIIMVNSISFDGEIDGMMQEFRDKYDADDVKRTITVDSSFQIDPEQNDQMSMASSMKLLAVSQTDSVDVYMMPKDIFEGYVSSGLFMDIREVLDEELEEELKDQFVMGKTEEDTEEVPYGLVLHDCAKLDGIFLDEDVYIGFAYRLKDPEIVVDFVKYLLS